MPKNNNSRVIPKKSSSVMIAAKVIMLVMTAVWGIFMTSLTGAGLLYNSASYGPYITRIGALFIVSAVLMTAGAVLCIFRRTMPNLISLICSCAGLALCLVMLYKLTQHADSAGWSDKFTMEPISGMYMRRVLPVIIPAVLAAIIAAVQLFSYEAAEERRERRRRRQEEKDAPAPPIV